MATGHRNDVLHHLRRAALRPDDPTDGHLLECFIARHDEVAFEALVRRHGPMVLGVCRRVLRNEADAEDAFQATFLVLARKAASVVPRALVGNWLYGVAHRTALRARAMNSRRRAKERLAAKTERRNDSEETFRQLQALLDEELSRLPDKYCVPIVLCDLEGKAIKEAARQLGWPQGTTATRLWRGRALLARRLARHGFALSAGAVAAVSPHAAPACVRAPLMVSTVGAAVAVAAGKTATAVISPRVAALMQGVLQSMLLAKLRTAMVVLLALGVVAIGVSVPIYRSLAANPADTEKASTATANVPETVASSAEEPKKDEKEQQGTPKPEVKGTDGPTRTASWQVRASLKAPAGAIAMAFSPDGGTLAVRGNKATPLTVTLWDVGTGQVRATLKTETVVSSVAFAPDGKTLAWPEGDRGVTLWDVAKGQKSATLKENTGFSANAVAYSPDGKLLAVGGYAPLGGFQRRGEVKLWDLTTGKESATLGGYRAGLRGFVSSVAFSPDGGTLASGSGDGTVRLWEVAGGKERVILKGHTGMVNSVAFSPEGKTLATASHDNTAKLWDAATGKELATLEGHTSWVRCLAFTPDGKILATGSENGVVKLWDAATGREHATLATAGDSDTSDGRVYASAVWSVTFSPDGRALVTGGGGPTVKLWGLQGQSVEKKVRSPLREQGPQAR